MIYCPYTNTELPAEHCSSEHILPLALGGMNGIELPVSRLYNSSLGSELDGAMANAFLTLMKRNKYDVRGHSGKRPVYIARKSFDSVTKAPLQLHLDQQEGLKAWDPRARRFESDSAPNQVTFNVTMDMDLELRFVAKVALAAGYFVYGNLFRSHANHDDLRKIMNCLPLTFGEELFNIQVLADSRFSEPGSTQLKVFRKICEISKPASVIGLVPSTGFLAIFVGILGEYIGMLNIPTNTSKFPNEGDYDWGHFIRFNRKTSAVRTSFRTQVLPFADPRS